MTLAINSILDQHLAEWRQPTTPGVIFLGRTQGIVDADDNPQSNRKRFLSGLP